jgi:hypothetical protein
VREQALQRDEIRLRGKEALDRHRRARRSRDLELHADDRLQVLGGDAGAPPRGLLGDPDRDLLDRDRATVPMLHQGLPEAELRQRHIAAVRLGDLAVQVAANERHVLESHSVAPRSKRRAAESFEA